jgi:hypothetical protein
MYAYKLSFNGTHSDWNITQPQRRGKWTSVFQLQHEGGVGCISLGMNILGTWEPSLISCEQSCKCYKRHNQLEPFCSAYDHGCSFIIAMAFVLCERPIVSLAVWKGGWGILLHTVTLNCTLSTAGSSKMKNRRVGGCGMIHWGLECNINKRLTEVTNVTLTCSCLRNFCVRAKYDRGRLEIGSDRCYL